MGKLAFIFIPILLALPGQSSPLTISEINYSGNEFLELYNQSDLRIDLTGYTIIGGIDAFLVGDLSPGEYAVVVENEARFRQEYGSRPAILAEFERRLDNDGEEIAIRDPFGKVIFRLSYHTRREKVFFPPEAELWPPDYQRKGFPLELIDPQVPLENVSDGRNWRRSFLKRGSPGSGSDLDFDGLDDRWEVKYFSSLDPVPEEDTDGDGLTHLDEQTLFTHPRLIDSDYDGLPDPDETNTGVYVSPTDTGTDPTEWDTDNDGLSDGQEIPFETPSNAYATSPTDRDSDDDGFGDGDEVRFLGDPLDPLRSPGPPRILEFKPVRDTFHAGETVFIQSLVEGQKSSEITLLGEPEIQPRSIQGAQIYSFNGRQTLIEKNSGWKYDNTEAEINEDWTAPDFDDSGWPVAPAPFASTNGFLLEDPLGLSTLIDHENAVYFRSTFDLAQTVPGNWLEATWGLDGGGALYFDGKMIARARLPATFNRTTSGFDNLTDNLISFTPEPISGEGLTIASQAHSNRMFRPGIYFGFMLEAIQPRSGAKTFQVTARNPFGIVQESFSINILDDLPPPETYRDWIQRVGGPADPSAPEWSTSGDLDGDGIENLLEFLTGSDPLQPNQIPLHIRLIKSPNSGRISLAEITLRRHRNPGNAGLRLQRSPDLLNWLTLPTRNARGDDSSPHKIEVVDHWTEEVTYEARLRITPPFYRLRGYKAD